MMISVTVNDVFPEGECSDYLQFNAAPSNDARIKQIHEIWELIDDAEANSVRVKDFLDYVPMGQHLDFFQRLVAKLAHGGTLTLLGNDFYSVAKAYVNAQMNLEQLNVERLGKAAAVTNTYVADMLKQLGLKITQRKLEGVAFCVTGERL